VYCKARTKKIKKVKIISNNYLLQNTTKTINFKTKLLNLFKVNIKLILN